MTGNYAPWWVDLHNPTRVLSHNGERVIAHTLSRFAPLISTAPELRDLLVLALPYVEEAAEHDHNSLEGQLRISVLATDIKAALAKADGKDAT